jgi:hypothetical protein
MSVASHAAIDHDVIAASVRARIRRRDPRLADLADESIARLTPQRWTLEWRLPEWLGARFGIDQPIVRELVESNVLGLMSVRLTDDLADSEVAEEGIEQARALAALTYDEALDVYRRRFAETSALWALLDRSMREWRTAADGPDHASRGAPLKIAAYACCLLDRLEMWPALERCLARSITALVLYDQFVDWEADVDAGRWNAFVATIQGPAAAPLDRTRAAVLAAMLTRDVVDEHFDRIATEAVGAARQAADLGLGDMAAFLRSWADATAAQGARAAAHYRGVAVRATRLLFQNAPDRVSGGGPG